MEKTTHSNFSKLMSFAFIAMGVFLGIYAFFANAEQRNIGGSLSWNNMTGYLDSTFWNASPTTGDIITALYGSGDEGSVYTTNWSGYNSGVCLSAGMTVEYTGVIPSTISANTIYVIASGTYDLSTTISMNTCSALISSGNVILSGSAGTNALMTILEKENIILDHINTSTSTNKTINIYSGTNFTINAGIFSTDTETHNGIYMIDSSYGTIINSQISANKIGIMISDTHNIILSNLEIHDNADGGVYITDSQTISFINTLVYDNYGDSVNHGYGINATNISASTFTDVETYNNIGHNISLSNSSNNTFTNIVANASTTAMGLYVANSSGNIFSGVQAFGNYYAGIHFYNSDNNTVIDITANSNEGGLYMKNSTGNHFEGVTIENNTKNGVMFVSGSNDNILSGAIVSGNMIHGIYMSNSDSNILYNVTSNNNNRVGLLIETGDSNIIENSTISNNMNNGIQFSYGSGNTINTSTISLNNNHGIGLHFSQDNQILNSTIDVNGYNGINASLSNNTIISGCNLSGNMAMGISFTESHNNTITNSHYYFGGYRTWNYSIYMANSTGNTINQFSGNRYIYEYHSLGLFQYTTYDSYTQSNNYIQLSSYDSATLTGNILTIGSSFIPFFEELKIDTSSSNFFWLPGVGNTFTISGANRDGTLYSPIQITAGSKLCMVGETGTHIIENIVDTIEIVSGNTYLTMSGLAVGTINYLVLSGASGQTLNILKSTDGTTRSTNSLNNTCTLDEYLNCTFYINGAFKLFAFGAPTGSFTGTTETGAIVTSGGVYNTGITITFENPNLSGATLNGNSYTGGTLITGDDHYVFIMEDTFGNTTGMSFTIDTMGPICTGTTLGGDIIELMPSEILFGSMFLGFDPLNDLEGERIFNTGLILNYYDENLSGARIVNIADQDFTGEVLGDGDYIAAAGFYIIMLDDTLGNEASYVFIIDYEDPTVTLEYPTNGLIINDNNDITFAFTGSDDTMIVGYTLYITGAQIYSGDVEDIDDNEEFMIHTVPLINGNYTWYVEATDIAGNTGISNINSFTIKAPLTGDAILSGSNVQYITGQGWYTRNYANISMRANDPINYTIAGSDFSLATGNFIGSQIHNILLTGTDGRKDVFVTMTNSSGEYISKSFTLYLDTQASVPTLITPASGATITTPLTLTWNAGPDNAGLSGYRYYVSTTNTFGTIIASGTTITPSVTLQSTQFSGPGTYYWYVVFVDKLGNLESSEIQTFMYSGSSVDTTPNSFTFTDITGTLPNRTYTSSTITIIGMTANTPVLASVSNGALYISGNFVGTTGYVQNGWTVNIELISSVDYEKTVSSTLTINGISDTFNITTKTNNGINDDIESTLSNTEKLMIISIFETLRDVYAGDKEVEFFNTFMVVLENRIDDYNTNNHEYEALTYLCNIIQTYYDREFSSNNIDGTRWIVNGIYIAPNGKKYPITYDSSKQRFTSSNFVVPKYFPTLDTLKYIIDINNPVGSSYSNSKSILARWKNASIDGTRQSSPYTAPNKKSFYFFKTITGKYSSYTFTSERYFDSLDATKEFIYNSNK